jgi:hypothetical protein
MSLEPASDAGTETLVQIQIAAFHHDSVLYPGDARWRRVSALVHR